MIYEIEKPDTILTDLFGHSNKNKDFAKSSQCKIIHTYGYEKKLNKKKTENNNSIKHCNIY